MCYDRYFGGEHEEFEFGEEVSRRFGFFVMLVVRLEVSSFIAFSDGWMDVGADSTRS